MTSISPEIARVSLPDVLRDRSVQQLHVKYLGLRQKEKKLFDFDVARELIKQKVLALAEVGCAYYDHPDRLYNCNCMRDAGITEDNVGPIVGNLVDFAIKTKAEQQKLIFVWIQYAESFRVKNQTDYRNNKTIYVLPGTLYPICRVAIQRLIDYGDKSWKTVKEGALSNTTPVHGSRGKKGLTHKKRDFEPALKQFFTDVLEIAAPRATKVIRELATKDDNLVVVTELRDTNGELVELPPSFNKSQLYKRYLKEAGVSIKHDSKHRVKELIKGDDHSDFCSETTFKNYWTTNYPNLVTQRPREDVCDKCYKWAHQFRYLNQQDSERRGGELSLAQQEERDVVMKERESLIQDAYQHVQAAKKMREYVNSKRKLAQETRDGPKEERVVCVVADFAQNCYVPHFGSEQPGEVYYMTPVNAYVFGVAHPGNQPLTLTAHTYFDGDAAKGGNVVASLLWKEFGRMGLTPPLNPDGEYELCNQQPVKEVNIVMDNCPGQNKNNFVLRLTFFLVKRKVCAVARCVFLVKGHTKNDCDRLFNLMKVDYRQRNIYTPTDLLDSMNSHEAIDAVQVETGDIRDWKAFQQDHMATLKIDGGVNHVFEYSNDHPKHFKIYKDDMDGPMHTQAVIKRGSWGDDQWYLRQPLVVEPPGLHYQRWMELHDRFSKYVPEEKKKDWKYYHTNLPKAKRDGVSESTKERKRAREDRERMEEEIAQPVSKSLGVTFEDATAEET